MQAYKVTYDDFDVYVAANALPVRPRATKPITERGVGLGETDTRLGVVLEGAVVVGEDETVAAQGFAVRGLVFEPAEEAFFGEQAFEEGEIAFAVLHGHAALGVGGGVGQLLVPVGDELAVVFPVGEEFIDANSAAGKKRSFLTVRWNEPPMSATQRTKGDTRLARTACKGLPLP